MDTQEDLLKQRIEYEEGIFTDKKTYDQVIERLLEDSKYIALSLRFPYIDYYGMDVPNKYLNWQIRCAEELYKLIGREGIISYSENGLSWTRNSDNISNGLRQEIEPMVGYIIVEEETSNG